MNKKFIWSKKYSVNVKEMDEQHKQFIKIVNSLLKLADSHFFTKDEALIKVGQLDIYALYHLELEEKLFQRIKKYKDASKHIQAHNQFRKRSRNFVYSVIDKDKDQKEAVKEVAEYAGSWLLNHILIMDKGYSKFFSKNKEHLA